MIHERQAKQRLSNIHTVMVGTSLVRHAVGDADGGAEALAFGPAPFLRVAYSSATERQVFALAKSAVAAGARNLFIEINPIVSRFAFRSAGCGAVSWIMQKQSEARDTLRSVLLRRDVFNYGAVNFEVSIVPESPSHLTDVQLQRLYPIRVSGPCDADRWAALFAVNPELRVVLMVMPRAPVARAANGMRLMSEFHKAAQEFAGLTGAHLFIADPDGVWPALNFIDQAHLSHSGAARFRIALATFVAELP